MTIHPIKRLWEFRIIEFGLEFEFKLKFEMDFKLDKDYFLNFG